MIVIRDNVERVIKEEALQQYLTNGYQLLDKNISIKQQEKKELSLLKTEELKKLAKEKGINGYSSLNKEELLAVLKDVV